jgi:hypothetical protein
VPYIKQEDRPRVDEALELLIRALEGVGPGGYNYAMTKLALHMWNYSDQRYFNVALITGVLENVKQEFYRRVAAPYEDQKIAENGDVY